MGELGDVVRESRALRAANEPFLLATVVRVRGSAYRRPGARMLLTEGRHVAGAISGGCLERDLVARGWWRARGASGVLVTYDTRSGDDAVSAFGLGCEGVVDVLLERSPPPRALDFVAACLEGERRGVLATLFASTHVEAPPGACFTLGDGEVDDDAALPVACAALASELRREAREALAVGATTTWVSSDGSAAALVEVVEPPPHLFVVATGPDAEPVVRLAKALGWTVSVCDTHARFETRARFASADRRLTVDGEALAAAVDRCARPLAVVMSHRYEADLDALDALLSSRASYIGLLGPRRRSERLFDDLRSRGRPLDDDDLARVHAPVGLDLGAETPAEIALSILAEAQASVTGASSARLRETRRSIHGQGPMTLVAPEAAAE